MARKNNMTWDDIKSDALRIYRDENEDLNTTMAAIREIHGFKACPRTWKLKFKEWGCRKNIPSQDMQWIVAKGTERVAEGKGTTFDYYGTRVTTKTIENAKKRKTTGGPVSMSTPPNIVYGTPPGPESLSAASESLPAGFESLLASLESPSAGFENLSAGFESVSAGFESPHTDIGSQFAGPKGLPSIPESLYGGFKSLPAGLDSEQLSIMEMYEELDEYNAPLSHMLNISVTHPSSVRPLSSKIDHPPPTMSDLEKLPFTSAIEKYLLDEEDPWSTFSFFYRNNNKLSITKLQERAAQVLGLTDFPEEQNLLPYIHNIGEQFSQNLYSEMCWEEDEVFALDNSFGLAFTLAKYQDKLKCSVLEIASSAKHMHQVLLEHSTNMNSAHFGSKEEIGIGHWSYGPFLKNKGRRTSRIDQLLLACESAMNSETHDSQLIAPLQCDFIDLLLGIELDEDKELSSDIDSLPRFERLRPENGPYAEESTQMLTFDLHQNSPRPDLTWSSDRQSRVREFLLSNYHSCNTSSERNPHLAQPGLFSGIRIPAEGDRDPSGLFSKTSNSAEEDGNPSSTGSLIESSSCKYGLTYSVSEITGISDSIFMSP